MRTAFISALANLAEKDNRIFVITPDLGFSVFEEFESKFPDRFINVGIAESNAVGIAAGLALSGKIVYVYSIIPFITMRPFEQIRNNLAYMNTNVRLVGVGAGLTYGAQGATHHAIEDIAIMRALPNMSVLVPCDPYEVKNIVKESVNYKGPMYLRLAKKNEPTISSATEKITIGKINEIESSSKSEITLLFVGNASDIALTVRENLKSTGVESDIASVHSIKPFDYSYLEYALKRKKYIFTIEEHNTIGGLGSIVSEYIAESKFNPIFRRFGLPDEYSHYIGDQSFIRNKMKFTPSHIVNKILQLITNNYNKYG